MVCLACSFCKFRRFCNICSLCRFCICRFCSFHRFCKGFGFCRFCSSWEVLICNCIFLYHSVGQICSFLDFAGLLSAVDFVWPSEYVTPVIIVVSVEFIFGVNFSLFSGLISSAPLRWCAQHSALISADILSSTQRLCAQHSALIIANIRSSTLRWYAHHSAVIFISRSVDPSHSHTF